MLYCILGVVLCLLLVVLWYLKKLLVMVNEIKKYQYTNNLKMLGFIKKELGQLFVLNKQWEKVRIHKGDKNVK